MSRLKETPNENAAVLMIEILRLMAETHFDLDQLQSAWDSLKLIRKLEEDLYGPNSKQVLDTDYAVMAIMASLQDESNGPFAAKLWSDMLRRTCLLENTTTPKETYDPGPTCAKNIVADFISNTERGQEGTGDKLIRICKTAYSERLGDFGPDSLLTLLAQRRYILEKYEQLGQGDGIPIEEKKKLVSGLENFLGKDHRLCINLEDRLGFVEVKAPQSRREFKVFTNDGSSDQWEEKTGNSGTYLGAQKVSSTDANVEKIKTMLAKHKDQLIKSREPVESSEEVQAQLEAAEAEVSRLSTDLGPKHQNTLSAQYVQAMLLLKLFKYDQGFSNLMEIYTHQAETLGHSHADALKTLDSICSTDFSEDFVSVEVLQEAKAFFDVLMPNLKKLPANRADLVAKLKWYFGYLMVTVASNDSEGAVLMGKARDAYNEAVENPMDIHGHYMSFGIALEFQHCDQNKIAKSMMDKTYPHLEAMLDENDRLLLRLRIGLALNAHRRNKNKEALTTLKDVYQRACDHLKPEDPVVGLAISKLYFVISRVRLSQGPREGDLTFLKNAHARLENLLGADHPETVKALAVLCRAYGSWGLLVVPSEAEVICRTAAKLAAQVFGREHEVTIKAMYGLAAVLAKDLTKKNHAEAKRLLLELLKFQKKLKGDNYAWYCAMLTEAQAGFLAMDDLKMAAELAEEAYTTCCNNLGPQHPQTAMMKQAMDMAKEAEKVENQ